MCFPAGNSLVVSPVHEVHTMKGELRCGCVTFRSNGVSLHSFTSLQCIAMHTNANKARVYAGLAHVDQVFRHIVSGKPPESLLQNPPQVLERIVRGVSLPSCGEANTAIQNEVLVTL